ncbi:MAG: efflux RND transporter periplasmic adaptor subunit [Desulfosalsimonadaceae bacterium]|nr:efflux RND transporter periplasmic adaptor subunit [Desulfosalsimonadaceae bacterium]
MLAIVLLTLACSEKEQTRPEPAVPVKTAFATQKDVPEEMSAIGTVEASSVVNITSRVDGQIMKIHIREGQDVKQGQVLLDIDDRPYQSMLESARANLARDRVKLQKAKIDAARYADLLRKDYVTKSQAEQTQADAESLEAMIRGDVAAVDNAALNVSYCRITSPVNGRTGEILINEGNLVKSGDSTKALMVIHQIEPVYVRFSVPEQGLPKIQSLMANHGLTVIAAPPGTKDQTQTAEGRLTFTDNTINPDTGTIHLKAEFDNKDNRLWPGQFVNVTLVLGMRTRALVAPSAAILMGQQGNFIFVVKSDMTVESRNVTPGPQINNETVIEEGIAPGDQVVIDGQLRLVPGAKVIVKNDSQPGGDSHK